MTRIAKHEFIQDAPFLQKLADIHGVMKAGELLGLSHVGTILREKKVRPAYEIAAKALIGEVGEKPHSYVIKLSAEHEKIVIPLLKGLDVPYLELDF